MSSRMGGRKKDQRGAHRGKTPKKRKYHGNQFSEGNNPELQSSSAKKTKNK